MSIKPKFAKKNRDTILPSKLALLVNDLIAILLFAVSLMLSLALATHSANDSCWSKTINSSIIYNKLGIVGAYLSDILFYIFGFSAWWLVIGLFYLGYYKISRKKVNTGSWSNIYQIISYIILIAASCTFEYVAFFNEANNLPTGVGGSLGSFLFSFSYRAFGEVGAPIASLVLIVVCFSFAFTVSWGSISQKIGVIVEFIYCKLVGLVERKDIKLPEVKLTKDNSTDFGDDPLFSYTKNITQNESTHHPFQVGEELPLNLDNAFDHFNDNAPIGIDEEIELSKHSNKLEQNPNNPIILFADDGSVPNKFPETLQNESELASAFKSPPMNYEKSSNESVPAGKSKLRISGLKTALKNNSLDNVDLLDAVVRGSLPSTSLLNLPRVQAEPVSPEAIEYVSNTIENTLGEFGIEVKICNVETGPVITRYELVPPKGVRGEKIASLAKEIARSLALPSIRIVETIPGKNSMGIEVPNFKRQVIYLKEIFDSAIYKNNTSLLTLALGKDIAGEVIVTDLAKMPHLLVAGTTGSGKSVAVNAMILSILFNATPDEVKFIMIDPKMVELSFYQGIPHLLAPVVTDMSQAANALKWTVGEMEQRYKIMAKIGTKNIISFNQKVDAAIKSGTPIYNPYSLDLSAPEPLNEWPYIVVIIDELADLMMVAGKKIEQYIARIAQKARAVGIHLVVATQRPSVDVITGLIKANIPARVSFQVSSKIDSRTILDQMGAEALLGQGDMLFLNPGSGFPRRIHGAFVNDDELHRVVDYLKEQGEPNYNEDILSGAADVAIPGFDDESNENNSVEKDTIFDEAVKFIIDSKRCSISSLQTQFGIGYNKAARIMNHLEKIGMVRRNDRGGFELLNSTP